MSEHYPALMQAELAFKEFIAYKKKCNCGGNFKMTIMDFGKGPCKLDNGHEVMTNIIMGHREIKISAI